MVDVGGEILRSANRTVVGPLRELPSEVRRSGALAAGVDTAGKMLVRGAVTEPLRLAGKLVLEPGARLTGRAVTGAVKTAVGFTWEMLRRLPIVPAPMRPASSGAAGALA